MKTYIGAKLISARPMSRAEYNHYRGWELPSNENGSDDGYLVEYQDGGKPNMEGHAGYISWSPAEQFDNAYRETIGMTFGLAIEAIRKGRCVARGGWNGANQFVFLIKAADLQNSLKWGYGEYLGEPTVQDALAIKTTNGQVQIGWLATQSDMLASDWKIVS